MSEQVKKLVPKLRFPEFKNAEDWQEKSLHQICEVNPSVKKLPDTFVYIDLESVESGVLLQKKQLSLDGAPSRAQRLLKSGDVIFQVVRPYQKNNYFFEPVDDLNYVASTGYAQLRAFESNKYLFHYLHNDRFVARVIAKCTGSNYPAINSSDLSEIKTEIPTPEEQQKIADCLSSLDDLITAQNQKVEALKQHKKGLMQQLFPAEGETVPKLRFPEFENDGEWEESAIGQVAIYENGKAHEQDISEHGRYIVVNSKFISTEGKVKKYTNEGNCLAKKNDILMVLSDVPNGRAIAKCFVVDEDNKYTVNQRICKLTPTEVNSKFLFYLVNRNEYFLSFDDGVKQTNLKNDDVLNCPLLLPENPIEQEKIAICLSLLDEAIDIQVQKIELLIDHKKGLMQQLFPSISEVEK